MRESTTPHTPSFEEFATKVYPFLELQQFHYVYFQLLELFAQGKIRRLMVSMPPQHGKLFEKDQFVCALETKYGVETINAFCKGRIVGIEVEQGKHVKKGDILAWIEKEE